MWDFSQYMFGERAFNGFFQGSSKLAGAGAGMRAGVGVRTSRMVLKICCKSFSEYLGTLVVAAGEFGFGSLLGCSENSDLGGGEESEGAIERRS